MERSWGGVLWNGRDKRGAVQQIWLRRRNTSGLEICSEMVPRQRHPQAELPSNPAMPFSYAEPDCRLQPRTQTASSRPGARGDGVVRHTASRCLPRPWRRAVTHTGCKALSHLIFSVCKNCDNFGLVLATYTLHTVLFDAVCLLSTLFTYRYRLSFKINKYLYIYNKFLPFFIFALRGLSRPSRIWRI
jgi:hypothetical protein